MEGRVSLRSASVPEGRVALRGRGGARFGAWARSCGGVCEDASHRFGPSIVRCHARPCQAPLWRGVSVGSRRTRFGEGRGIRVEPPSAWRRCGDLPFVRALGWPSARSSPSGVRHCSAFLATKPRSGTESGACRLKREIARGKRPGRRNRDGRIASKACQNAVSWPETKDFSARGGRMRGGGSVRRAKPRRSGRCLRPTVSSAASGRAGAGPRSGECGFDSTAARHGREPF